MRALPVFALLLLASGAATACDPVFRMPPPARERNFEMQFRRPDFELILRVAGANDGRRYAAPSYDRAAWDQASFDRAWNQALADQRALDRRAYDRACYDRAAYGNGYSNGNGGCCNGCERGSWSAAGSYTRPLTPLVREYPLAPYSTPYPAYPNGRNP